MEIKRELKLLEAQKILNIKNIYPVVKSLIDKKVCYVWESLADKYKEKKETYVLLNAQYHSEEALEKLVNEWIAQDLPMQRMEMPRADAEQIGAEMEFGVKYPDMVSVYFIGNDLDTAISKEFCGGPHIDHTGLIGTFKIQKEEASSAGVRRIKATIE